MVSPASDFDSVFEQAGPASKPGDAVSLKRKASDQGQRENLQVYETMPAQMSDDTLGERLDDQYQKRKKKRAFELSQYVLSQMYTGETYEHARRGAWSTIWPDRPYEDTPASTSSAG